MIKFKPSKLKNYFEVKLNNTYQGSEKDIYALIKLGAVIIKEEFIRATFMDNGYDSYIIAIPNSKVKEYNAILKKRFEEE